MKIWQVKSPSSFMSAKETRAMTSSLYIFENTCANLLANPAFEPSPSSQVKISTEAASSGTPNCQSTPQFLNYVVIYTMSEANGV